MDIQLEQEKLKRERAITDALLMASQKPSGGQMVGPHYASGGFFAALAPVVQAYMAKKRGAELDDKQSALAEQASIQTQDELNNYFKTRDGYTKPYDQSQIQSFMEQDQPLPEQEVVPGDKRRAAISAFTSRNPALQELGKTDIAGLGKSSITGKDLLTVPDTTAESRVAAALAENPGLLKGMPKNLVVGNQVLDPTNLGVKYDGREKFGDVGPIGTGPDGQPIYGQKDLATGKATFAPQGTKVNVSTGDEGRTAFAKEAAKEGIQSIVKSQGKAQDAVKVIDTVQDAEADLARGIKSGAGAEIALALAKWGKALGFEASPEIANTESFRSNMAKQVFTLIKNLGAGTGISDADRRYADDAAAGRISLDDRTMYRVMNISKAAAGNILLEHNKLLNKATSRGGSVAEDLELMRVPFNLKASNEGAPDAMFFNPKSKRFEVKGEPPKAAAAPQTPAADMSGGNTVVAPNGKTYSFATPEAAAQFKQRAGIQ